MATVRDALKAMHAQNAEFCKAMAAHHEAMSGHHADLAEATDGDQSKIHAKISKAHTAAAKLNSDQAEACEGMAKCVEAVTTTKGMGNDPNAIVPDRISGIITHYPDVRAVPRFGAPGAAKDMPVEFQKLAEVDDL